MQHSQFGPYRVIRLLGQGGMGAVYEAVDPATGRSVAVKTLPLHLAHDKGIRQRFQAEIATLKNLRHPGIAQMIGDGMQDGLPFFVMEFVPGRTLEELLKSGRRFTWRDAVLIVQEILPPLKSAHDQGVVHRDLKPANLMFPPAPGGGFHVKLTDFGIAKLFGETGHTRAGIVIGTPEYMAPEQATGLLVDHRADLYSLGLVMFAMLAGKPPFQGSVADVVEAQKSLRPPRIATLVPDVPPALDDLIDALLAKPPESRPQHVATVARQLAAIASLPEPPTTQPRQPGDSPGGGGTRIDGGPPPPLPDDLPPTLAMPPGQVARPARRPTGLVNATTVADESGMRPGDGGHGRGGVSVATGGAGGEDGSGRSDSTYTTVEEQRKRALAQRKREAFLENLLKGAGALAVIATVVGAGWWFVLRPWLYPDPKADFTTIVAMLDNVHDLRNPCDAIERFLRVHPQDPRVAEVRFLGRDRALQMLQKRTRRRLPTYKPKSPAERLYLGAIRSEDLRDTVAKLKELIVKIPAEHAADFQAAAGKDPCWVVENPDEATWRELAERQVGIVEARIKEEDQLRQQEALTPAERARAMLNSADRLQQQAMQAEASGQAMQRVVAITERHEVLEELVDKFEDEPAAADEVAAARRLLKE
ncbi:MAG: serine/threonine protein kinase [Planctomycetes bacterium]|nr:serine/threonine protein kinase [Planctomycetota bacterium]